MTKRQEASTWVAYVVDDAGCGRTLHSDPHAFVRTAGKSYKYGSVLVGWKSGLIPLFVAVHSYMDVMLDDSEVIELATDYMNEITDRSKSPMLGTPDLIIR